MLTRKTITVLLAVGIASAALAQEVVLTENVMTPLSGPEAMVPRSQRATFDLTILNHGDWAGTTMRVLVTPAGQAAGVQIRHALGEPTVPHAPWGDLSSPLATTPETDSALLYDTWLAAPPSWDHDDPNMFHPYGVFYTLQPDVPGDGIAGRISTATEIGARNPQDHPIQLPLFDFVTTTESSFLHARLTFVQPPGIDLGISTGMGTPLVTIAGFVTDVHAPVATRFDFGIVPEPGGLALLALLAALLKGHRSLLWSRAIHPAPCSRAVNADDVCCRSSAALSMPPRGCS